MAFIIQRHPSGIKVGWTEFNKSLLISDPEITTVGYMPAIPSPAHEGDTLNTVVQ